MTEAQFVRRVLVASTVVLAVAAAAALLVRFPAVPLVLFAGVLGALLLDGAAQPLARRTGAPRRLVVVLLAATGIAAVALAAWLLGPRLVEQASEVVKQLGASMAELRRAIPRSPLGKEVLSAVQAVSDPPAQPGWKDIAPYVFGSLTGLFTSALGALTGLLAVVALAVFFALEPELYTRGTLLLVPGPRRRRVAEVLAATAHALRWWFVGRGVAMAIVAVLTLVGLLALGVRQSIALALVAGVLTFVPYVGPALAAVPAVIVALTDAAPLALWVVGLYTVVQGLENYVVTPLVQGRAVALPPALLVAASIVLGVLLGALGVLLATPLTIVATLWIQAFYVQDVMGEDVRLLGEGSGERRRIRERAVSRRPARET